jgi:hypothetical protein
MKKYLQEYIDNAKADFTKVSQLKNVKSGLYWLELLEKEINDPKVIFNDANNPVYLNGRWLDVTEPIKPIDVFSDEELLEEVKKRMNRFSAARG